MQISSARPGHSLFASVARWWRNLTGNRAGQAELNKFAPEDLGQMARDVGVNAGELRALAGKWPDAADLLTRRMAALDLDPDAINRSEPCVSNDLKKLCSLCISKGRCEHDLAQDPDNPVWREYCPNTTTLSALQAERAQQAKKIGDR